MTDREALTIFREIQKCRHQALHTNDCGNCEKCQYYHTQEQIDGAVALAISALEKQEQDRWIPVTERLPEDYSDVLVWFEYFRYGSYNRLYQTYGIGNYSAQYDAWTVNHETGWDKLRVIAWRQLPEPYKAEEEVTKTKNYTAGYRDCAGCMYEFLTTNREYPCSDCREMVGPNYPNRYESKDATNDEP